MQDDDTFIHGVRWTGSGGFAAWDGTQIVNIGGNAAPTGDLGHGRLRADQPQPDIRL